MMCEELPSQKFELITMFTIQVPVKMWANIGFGPSNDSTQRKQYQTSNMRNVSCTTEISSKRRQSSHPFTIAHESSRQWPVGSSPNKTLLALDVPTHVLTISPHQLRCDVSTPISEAKQKTTNLATIFHLSKSSGTTPHAAPMARFDHCRRGQE